MSVLVAIAVLALLIVVHELGHFTAARAQGIHVNRFSIGFGPILWKYQGSETEYAIRAFPLGGFVGFPDDDPETTIPPDDPDLLRNRPLLDRAIVISAGVIANLIFAYLLLVTQVGLVGVQELSQPGIFVSGVPAKVTQQATPAGGVLPGDVVVIQAIPPAFQKQLTPEELRTINQANQFELAVSPNRSTAELLTAKPGDRIRVVVDRKNEAGKSEKQEVYLTSTATAEGKGNTGLQVIPTVAVKAGLRPGDVVLGINGQAFGQSLREIPEFQKIIRENPGQTVNLQVRRGDRTFSLPVTPEANADNEGSIGIMLAQNGELVRRHVGGLAIFTTAAEEFQTIINDTIAGLGQLVSRFSKVANQVAGPVAIVAAGAKIAQYDAASLFQFAALISINLAIINILPLPALDGGHLAFLLIEGVRGKPLPTNVQDGVMQTGLMLLLGLGIFLIIRDTANLIPQ